MLIMMDDRGERQENIHKMPFVYVVAMCCHEYPALITNRLLSPAMGLDTSLKYDSSSQRNKKQ